MESNALEKFERFFELDLLLKEKLYNLAPPLEFLSEEEKFKYADKLYKTLISLEKYFIEITRLLGVENNITSQIEKKFQIFREVLMEIDYNSSDLKNVYNICFARMREELLDVVNNSFKGDVSRFNERKLPAVIDKCSSLNEVLHTFHVYMVNNKRLMNEIPTIDMKVSIGEGDPVILRGDKNPLAKSIYDAQDINFDTGEVDIVGFNKSNKILMLVRHRGHALSIQIDEKNENELGISYFVPKIHHHELIKNIRGLTNYEEGDTYAVGSFLVAKQTIGQEIFEFTQSVPTDGEYMDSPYCRF